VLADEIKSRVPLAASDCFGFVVDVVALIVVIVGVVVSLLAPAGSSTGAVLQL
jgi:hypothetical protein